MEIFKVFKKPMSEAIRQDELAKKLDRSRNSLKRRERRIDDLKKRLREERKNTLATDLRQAREIIAGLEQALLLHSPAVADARDARIAQLESQLQAMTSIVEAHYSTPIETINSKYATR